MAAGQAPPVQAGHAFGLGQAAQPPGMDRAGHSHYGRCKQQTGPISTWLCKLSADARDTHADACANQWRVECHMLSRHQAPLAALTAVSLLNKGASASSAPYSMRLHVEMRSS